MTGLLVILECGGRLSLKNVVKIGDLVLPEGVISDQMVGVVVARPDRRMWTVNWISHGWQSNYHHHRVERWVKRAKVLNTRV